MKQQKRRKTEKKNENKRHWAGPTGTLGGAVPGPHRPGWCIAPPMRDNPPNAELPRARSLVDRPN